MMIVLLAIVGIVLVRWLLRRFAGPAPQLAGAGAPMQRSTAPWPTASTPAPSTASAAAPTTAAAQGLPADFDAAGFARIAKMIFIRMQAANDAGNLNDLRQFATPEMFATFRLELQERGGVAQQTDVMKLDAQVLEAAEEGGQQIVSVRFHGLIVEEKDSAAQPFDEVWHFVKPLDGSREWAIAGIAQTA